MIASFLAVGLFFLDFRPPGPLATGLTQLGNLMTPLAMLMFGSIFGEMSWKEMFLGWRAHVIVAVKLLILPLLTFLVFVRFVPEPTFFGVLITFAAMPISGRCMMFAVHYDGNYKLASQGLFLSTIFSIVTVPFLIFLLL